MGFMKMVSMERTPEEKAEQRSQDMYPSAIADMPDVPSGLCLCLTEVELEKLNLDDECDVGDMIHLTGMAKVTSVSKVDTGSGCKCRIELAICSLSVEDEDNETPDDEGGEY